MRMKSRFLTGLAAILLSIPVLASGATYQIDPDHSSFEFKVRHMTVSNVRGQFTKAKGTVSIDGNDLTRVNVVLDAASVNTDHVRRDEHLRGEDFFHVVKYPTLSFVSKKVTQGDQNRLKVVGDLTIRGVTREVTVDVDGPTPEVKDLSGNIRRGATGTLKINRKDFGIVWHKTLDNGGLVVGDDVDISVEVELVRK
jgi:polyisoprenoid-binding protein YceI